MPDLPVLAKVQFGAVGALALFAFLGNQSAKRGHKWLGYVFHSGVVLALIVVASINDWG